MTAELGGVGTRLLGTARARVPSPAEDQVIEARLGVFNHEPFRVVRPAPSAPGVVRR